MSELRPLKREHKKRSSFYDTFKRISLRKSYASHCYASHLTKEESQIILYFLINQKIQMKMIRSAEWKNQKQVKKRVQMPQNH
jgi:hypothetical protein